MSDRMRIGAPESYISKLASNISNSITANVKKIDENQLLISDPDSIEFLVISQQ
jgi:hypothetical protein